MTSTIDPSVPADFASLLSAAVRNNFAAAATDINALQNWLHTASASTLISDYLAVTTDFILPCDTTAAGFMITVPLTLGTATKWKFVLVVKTAGANNVAISYDGVNPYTVINSVNDAGGVGWLLVAVNGTRMFVLGMP